MTTETNTQKTSRYIVKTSSQADEDYFPFSHPLGNESKMFLLPLSDRVGLRRLGLSIGRIPPGKEGFLPHAHAGQEEFVFVLSGVGTLTIEEEEATVEAGDFVGFPTDGAVHHLKNGSTSDFVYLMGGERTSTDVVHFPTIRKTGFWADGSMHYVDDDEIETLAPEDFAAKD